MTGKKSFSTVLKQYAEHFQEIYGNFSSNLTTLSKEFLALDPIIFSSPFKVGQLSYVVRISDVGNFSRNFYARYLILPLRTGQDF